MPSLPENIGGKMSCEGWRPCSAGGPPWLFGYYGDIVVPQYAFNANALELPYMGSLGRSRPTRNGYALEISQLARLLRNRPSRGHDALVNVGYAFDSGNRSVELFHVTGDRLCGANPCGIM